MTMWLGLVGLEQLFVDGDGVVERGGEGTFGRETVEDGDALDLGHAGDGDGLGVGAGVGVEAAAVEVEQDFVFVGFGQAVGDDDADGTPAILSSVMVAG
jgi:hypothetical protein